MKKLGISLLIAITVVFSIGLFAQSFWGGKTMSSREVMKKWGSDTLNMAKFKDGSADIKAKMAYSIMTDKSLIGKSFDYIRENFGAHDGYYFIDTYPAYIIQEGKNHSEETWQIVFKMDNHYKVKSIIVHKNCCEK